MAQILNVNALTYIENGKDGSGWYIIPPSFDIENASENGIAVKIENGYLTHNTGDKYGLPYSTIDDIYLIYSSKVFSDERLLNPILASIDKTKITNGPVKILITNDHIIEDMTFNQNIPGADGQPVSTTLVINRDVGILNVTSSENNEDDEDGVYEITVFNVVITFQNTDGSTATWNIKQAESVHQHGDGPIYTNQNTNFRLGADGDFYNAREFIDAVKASAPYFDADSLLYTLDENVADFDFAQAVIARSSLDLTLINSYALEGAPDGFTISSAGILSYDGNGLDHETAPEGGYQFNVIATAPNGATTTGVITVQIGDVEEPVVITVQTQGEGASIDENTADSANANVENISISLRDPDQRFQVSDGDITIYDTDEDSASSAFEAVLSGDSSDGSATITLHKIDGATIDHETKSVYNLEIRVVNEDGTTSSEQVTVNVIDVHDVGPDFSAATEISVDEGSVFNFDASATGDVAGLTITYAIVSHDATSGSFNISNTGQVTYVATDNSGAFDLGPSEDGQSEYNLSISADDGTFTTTHNLKITVQSNNVAPVLTAVETTGDVTENVSIAVNTGALFTIADANADDVADSFTFDISEGGQPSTRFEIQYNTDTSQYEIVKKDGVIFDYEDTSSYALSVKAIDRAGAESNAVDFTIDIEDVSEDLVLENQTIILNRGDETITVSSEHLNGIKSGGVEAEYEVVILPTAGSTFFLNGVALAVRDSFTQGDIDAGSLTLNVSDPRAPVSSILTLQDTIGQAVFNVAIEVRTLDDTLTGDEGDNILSGGQGDDRLAGRGGADKFVLGDEDDGTDIVTDFSSQEGDRVLIQRDEALDGTYTDVTSLLNALGLTLSHDEDRTNDGVDDTIIMKGTAELMILQDIGEFDLNISNFEIEVI